jgi:hypothetical protein
MNTGKKPNEPGVLLGVALLAVLLCLLVQIIVNGFEPGPEIRRNQGIIGGIYIQAWGLLFLLSYYFEHKSFLFRGLMWICEHCTSPKGRFMAFFYFALALGIGTLIILRALGVL